MSFSRHSKAGLFSLLLPLLMASAVWFFDPGVALAVETSLAAQTAVKPLLAGLHPATLAAFQLLASLTALVAFDD
jgi:hypothetical protein